MSSSIAVGGSGGRQNMWFALRKRQDAVFCSFVVSLRYKSTWPAALGQMRDTGDLISLCMLAKDARIPHI